MLARGAYGHYWHAASVVLFLLHDKMRYPVKEISSCNYFKKSATTPKLTRMQIKFEKK